VAGKTNRKKEEARFQDAKVLLLRMLRTIEIRAGIIRKIAKKLRKPSTEAIRARAGVGADAEDKEYVQVKMLRVINIDEEYARIIEGLESIEEKISAEIVPEIPIPTNTEKEIEDGFWRNYEKYKKNPGEFKQVLAKMRGLKEGLNEKMGLRGDELSLGALESSGAFAASSLIIPSKPRRGSRKSVIKDPKRVSRKF